MVLRMSTNSVECRSGYTYAERPTAIDWEGAYLLIVEIESRWRTPGCNHFRVRTEDGRTFELSYIEQEDEWHITLL
jgi:hypothetical protein